MLKFLHPIDDHRPFLAHFINLLQLYIRDGVTYYSQNPFICFLLIINCVYVLGESL